MKIKQISIFLENRKGRLQEVLTVLGKEKINIRALCIADTSEFGILRLIVSEPDRAKKVLTKEKCVFLEHDVIAIGVSDQPGGLAAALTALQEADQNVEYLYAFVGKAGKEAVVVIRTEKLDASIKILKKAGVKVLSPKEVYTL